MTPLQRGDTRTFVPLLCPSYACEGVTSVRDLLAIMEEKASAHPGACMLATLDDVGQAFYTSGHAIDANELDPIPDDDEVIGEDGTPPLPDLAIRLARLQSAASAVPLEQLLNRLWWTDEHRPSFFGLQDRPEEALDPEKIYIQAVPVAHAWETVAAFPNGYFEGDYTPMENLVLARHLQENFGYALFGIGASYVGFRRAAPLPAEQLNDLAAFIVSLHAESNGPDLLTKIRGMLAASDVLFLCYSAS